MLTKLLLVACLLGSIFVLSSGQQQQIQQALNNLNLDKLSGFLDSIKSLEPITVRCDHLWIQMSIESQLYLLPKRNQRFQFEVQRQDFKQLLDVMSNYKSFLGSNLQQCLNAFEHYNKEIGDNDQPFVYSREKIEDMSALVEYFDSFRNLDTAAQCSHFWMGSHVILFRRRPKLMQVFDKDEMVAMRDALNTQQNGRDNRESQMRNKLLNRMNMCLQQDIYSGSGNYNSGSYSGMQQGNNGFNNNGGYNNINVNFNGIQGINLLQILGLGNILQIATELHRIANNMDPAKVCGWLSNHLNQQLSSNQQMLMKMGEGQLFSLYKEALKSHDGGQGPIHGLLDRCINQAGGAQQQYGYNQNRDYSLMSNNNNNNYGGQSTFNMGGPLGVAAGIGLAALAGNELEQFVKNADRGLQSLWSNLVYHHQNDQFSPTFCAKLWANLRDSVTPTNALKEIPKLLLMANPNELELLADRLGHISVHRDRCENLRRCAKVLGEYRIQNNLGPIGAGLAAAGAVVGSALGADYLGGQLKNGLRELGNDIRGSAIVNGADYLGDQMKNGIRELGYDIRGSAIVNGADYLGDQMKNGLREMGDDIKNSALGVGAQYLGGQLKNGIQELGNDIRGSAIVTGADYLGDQMKNGIRELGNDIRGSAIVTGADYLGDQMKNGIREMKGDIREFGNAVQNPGGWVKTEITRQFSPQAQQFGSNVQQFGNSIQNSAGQWVGQAAGNLGNLGNLGQAAVGVAGLAAGGALAANLVGNVLQHHNGQPNQFNAGFSQQMGGPMQQPGFAFQASQSFGQNSYGTPSLQASFSQSSSGGSEALSAGLAAMSAILGALDLNSLSQEIRGISLDVNQCKGLLGSLVQQLGGVNMVTKHFPMHLIHPIEVEIAVMKQLAHIAQQRGMHQTIGNNLVNSANQCALIFDNNRSMGNSSLFIGNPNANFNGSGSFKQSFGGSGSGSRHDGYGYSHGHGHGYGHGHGHRGGHGRGPPGPCKLVGGACRIVKNVVGQVLDRIDP